VYKKQNGEAPGRTVPGRQLREKKGHFLKAPGGQPGYLLKAIPRKKEPTGREEKRGIPP